MKFTPMTLTAARKVLIYEMDVMTNRRPHADITKFRNVCRSTVDPLGAPVHDISAYVNVVPIHNPRRRDVEFIQALLTLSAYHGSEYSEEALSSLLTYGTCNAG